MPGSRWASSLADRIANKVENVRTNIRGCPLTSTFRPWHMHIHMHIYTPLSHTHKYTRMRRGEWRERDWGRVKRHKKKKILGCKWLHYPLD